MGYYLAIKRKVFPFLSLSALLLSLQFSISANAMEKDNLREETEETPVAPEELRPTHNLIAQEEEIFEKGNLLAAYTLGNIYQKGTEEIKKDLDQSAFWFRTFAETPYRVEQEDIWVLSIDGGGIRGLIPVTLLEMFEKDLSRRFGLDVYIADLLKIVAGTLHRLPYRARPNCP